MMMVNDVLTVFRFCHVKKCFFLLQILNIFHHCLDDDDDNDGGGGDDDVVNNHE